MKKKINYDEVLTEKPNKESDYLYRRKNWKKWSKCRVYKKMSEVYKEKESFRHIEWWVLFLDSCTPIRMRELKGKAEWLKS